MRNEIRLLPPRRSTVVESIVEQLVNQIQSGMLKPGDRLPPERELIEMLGVSRSSVREALQGLAAMGLVEIRHGEGTFVKSSSSSFGMAVNLEIHPKTLQKEMRMQINRARLILESGIITEACAKLTPENAAAIMQTCTDWYDRFDNYPTNSVEWIAHDRIHLTIAEATGNRFLVQMVHSLLELVPVSLREGGVFVGDPKDIQQNFRENKTIHYEMCKAIVRKDEISAQEWMVRHAKHEEDTIARYYGEAITN